jgi:metallophosphoesterase (TIGR03767 family)
VERRTSTRARRAAAAATTTVALLLAPQITTDATKGGTGLVTIDRSGYLRRTDIGGGNVPPAARPLPLLTFTQLTDTHLVDEESPLRTEFLDGYLGTAYRPQEGLTTQVLARMAERVRVATSPFSGRQSALVVTTGDNTDNGQRNEVRWLIDILDGGVIEPDSGVPGTCGLPDDGRRFHGMQGESHYLDRPGLLEGMNQPFRSQGVGLPWYVAYGNHDGLVQGNATESPLMTELAAGCHKVVQLPQVDIEAIVASGEANGRDGFLQAALAAIVVRASEPFPDPGLVRTIPSDADRVPLGRFGYIAEHFRTVGRPVGHGFGTENLATGHAWYDLSPVPGVRFLVLDSVSPTGGHNGNIGHEQFRWIHERLEDAERNGELAIAFAHHTLRTIVQDPSTVFDRPAPGSPPVHYGLGASLDCPTWDPIAPPGPRESLRCLFLRHPALVGFVNGHEHRNLIEPFARPADAGVPGGFWQITTASHIDWPQQSRMLDIVDNRDGTISIVATLLDHSGPGIGSNGTVAALASIALDLATDEAASRRGDGALGAPSARNVELLVPDPYR